jgi:hypothetical protein
VRGDLTDAEADVAQAALRVEQLGFPRGPFGLACMRLIGSSIRIEAGQLDEAAVLAAGVTDLGERHGFDIWRLFGATQQATVNALAALAADHLDLAALSAHITTINHSSTPCAPWQRSATPAGLGSDTRDRNFVDSDGDHLCVPVGAIRGSTSGVT